jgi:hypothetical protein
MDIIQIAMVALAIGGFLSILVWVLTRSLRVSLRLPVRTLFIALVITPSLACGAGEGGAGCVPLPALAVFYLCASGGYWKYLLLGFAVPVACVWALALVISLIYFRFSKRKHDHDA